MKIRNSSPSKCRAKYQRVFTIGLTKLDDMHSQNFCIKFSKLGEFFVIHLLLCRITYFAHKFNLKERHGGIFVRAHFRQT